MNLPLLVIVDYVQRDVLDGTVTRNVRGVAFDWGDEEVLVRYYLDGPATPDDHSATGYAAFETLFSDYAEIIGPAREELAVCPSPSTMPPLRAWRGMTVARRYPL